MKQFLIISIAVFVTLYTVITFASPEGIYNYGSDTVYIAGELFVINTGLPKEEATESLQALLEIRKERHPECIIQDMDAVEYRITKEGIFIADGSPDRLILSVLDDAYDNN